MAERFYLPATGPLGIVPTVDRTTEGTEPEQLVPIFLDCENGRYFYIEGSEGQEVPNLLLDAALAVLRDLDEELARASSSFRYNPPHIEALRHALALNGRPT